MSAILDAITGFVESLGIGTFPLPPKSDAIAGHVPNFKGLQTRDARGIIMQVQPKGPPDGGDSAHRTGVAAFCNSAMDQALLKEFEHDGLMVRHPAQAPWNNPNNCSRDQLKGYVAGCWRAGYLDINQRLFDAHARRVPPFTCQNTHEAERGKPSTPKDKPIGDVLLPHDVMYLRICVGDAGAFMDPLGQFSLHAAIVTAKTEPEEDNTNLMLESIVCGRLNLFVQIHKNYGKMLDWYWSGPPTGWKRNQPQIAQELKWVVKKNSNDIQASLSRYSRRIRSHCLRRSTWGRS